MFKQQHYVDFAGEKVAVRLVTPQDGRRNFTGQLKSCIDGVVIVEVDGVEYSLLFSNIEKANIVPNFDFK